MVCPYYYQQTLAMSARIVMLLYASVICFVLSWKEVYGVEGRKMVETHSHTIQLTSLLPSHSCKPSSQESSESSSRTSLQVVHKHGPCSQFSQDKSTVPSHSEILHHDESRVSTIHSKLSKRSVLNGSGGGDAVVVSKSSSIPAKDGSTVGSGNYIVTVGLGTPTKQLSLIFDTASDLTWTQCEPCVKYCYNQKEQKFNPTQSSSYSNISCSASVCSSLTSATGNSPSCASSTCVYGIQYGDSSYSVGFFGKEKLTLTSTDVFDNFYFGCGQNNRGLFGGAAGLLGLGRDKLSLVSQTAPKYNKLFSYCLPSTDSYTGFLSFGGTPSKYAKFTPLSTISNGDSFYGIDFTGITVGGKKLPISDSIFSTASGIIDSGTIITRLHPTMYSHLRFAFRQGMSKYPTAPALSILDTCYDFTNYNTVRIPKIGLYFSGGLVVDVDAIGILYVNKISQVCLAFAPNGDDSDVVIFGSMQQQTFEIIYDSANGRIGFAPKGCS